MKTILTVLLGMLVHAAFAADSDSYQFEPDSNKLPQTPGRYQLIEAKSPFGDVKDTFVIDTATGRTWVLSHAQGRASMMPIFFINIPGK